MALSDLIPASFFAAPAHVVAAAVREQERAARVNGTVTLRTGQPNAGHIVVGWDRQCPAFNTNLAAARRLKDAGHGTYRPDQGGWVFAPAAAAAILAGFPTLHIDPAVVALAAAPKVETVKAAPAAPAKHGTIRLEDGQYLVQWGGEFNVPGDVFQTYVAAAREVKAQFPASRGYDGRVRGWRFTRKAAGRLVHAFPVAHFDHPAELVADAAEHPAEVLNIAPPTVEELDAGTLAKLDALADCDVLQGGQLPGGMTLYAHQIEGVRFLVTCRTRIFDNCRLRGVIVADEMGLGKTITALAAAYAHQQAGGVGRVEVHVICPRPLIVNWRREARRVGVSLEGVTTNHHASLPAPASITRPFVLIVDEAHAFQNLSAARTKALLALAAAPLCEGIYLLTGTPMKNGRPINMLPLLAAINHGIAHPAVVSEYKQRYCGPEAVFTGAGTVMTYDGATNLADFHARTSGAVLRRTKAECLDLPPKVRSMIAADVTEADERAYLETLDRLRDEYVRRLRAGQIKPGADAIVALNHVRHAGEVAKVGPAVAWAEEVLEQGGQCLIFTEFVETARAIAAALHVPAFTGETTDRERQRIVDAFQRGDQKAFVATRSSGGVGLTLHADGKCRDVLLVSRPWTPGDAEQVEDRAHRIGQTGTVNAGWLQYGPADPVIDAALAEKAMNASEALTGVRVGLAFDGGAAALANDVLEAMGWN